jgi:hypothetical protein
MVASPRRAIAFAAVLGSVSAVALTVAAVGSSPAGPRAAPKDVCQNKDIRKQRGLLCPDLEMRPPFDLERARRESGTPVLEAANSIDSVGQGAASLRGKRKGPLSMDARQKVAKRGPGRAGFDTGAKLAFKRVPGQGRYWKFRDAAKFELWALDDAGDRTRRIEVGPKQVYCLRDLDHTHPGMKRSPNGRVFPSCNQNPGKQRVTLGTSVGWSDVYPHTYHQNFIELDHVPKRGCYAYVHIADPKNGIFELDESNNEASTVVYLTPSGGWKPGRCEGVRDRALPLSQTTDDSRVQGSGGGGRPY